VRSLLSCERLNAELVVEENYLFAYVNLAGSFVLLETSLLKQVPHSHPQNMFSEHVTLQSRSNNKSQTE
jgi:hypothetical protein